MTITWLLPFVAAIELGAGAALGLTPEMSVRLLLGADVTGAGVIVARMGGLALLALGAACLASWRTSPARPQAGTLAAMLTYNPLVAMLFIAVGVGDGPTGPLLWPAAVLHLVLTALFIAAWRSRTV